MPRTETQKAPDTHVDPSAHAERTAAADTPPPGTLTHWRAMARPPATALKTIKGGRLRGMTDVNPQWRYQAMTEQFGPCGDGWKYTIDRLWTEPGCDGEVLAFAQVSVLFRVPDHGEWSDPIVGIGGNHLVVKESAGLRNNDECWKMAVTDALSVALKMLGVAADIYAGLWDGSKYRDDDPSSDEADGYQQFLTDMEIVASEQGFDALVAAVKAAGDGHRTALRADTKTWAALKAKAEKADAAAKGRAA